MGVTDSERDVLRVLSELKTGNRIDISQRIGLSSAYVEYLCKYLVKGGYLKLVGRQRYALTPQGKKVVASLGYGLEEKKEKKEKKKEKRFAVDWKLVKDIASKVAKEVAKEVTRTIKLKEARAYPVTEEEKIRIKTDYIPPLDYEEIKLESNIEKVGVEIEVEKSDIDKSVKLFRDIRNKKKG